VTPFERKQHFLQQWEDSAQQWPERSEFYWRPSQTSTERKRRLQMNKFRFTIKVLVIATFMFAFASIAQAQATRTWVSGVGDDVNPCSRTAPCKTFAGAISKTAAGGEIDCLDPGGFGAVTITKSITIDGTHGGGFGGILASLTTGIIVNDGATGSPGTIVVRLHSLSINGALNGTNGIRYISGKSLFVDDCQIFGFRGAPGFGIDASLTLDGGQLWVKDSIIDNNASDGIRATTTVGQIKVIIDNVKSQKNAVGIHVSNNASVFISNSATTNNTSHGVQIENNTSANLVSCTMFGNAGNGLNAGAGAPSVRLSDNNIINNTGVGVNIAGGTVFTFGDNKIRGNGGGDVVGVLNGTTTKQ
jgi:hypothetical protein